MLGASYIKDPLISLLVARKAVNIHMGVSPYYRGASCNFWAMYDRRPEMVGATIHRLSSGLDSGHILFHAFPKAARYDAFEYRMQCVRAAQQALAAHIRNGSLNDPEPVAQDKESRDAIRAQRGFHR